MYIYILKLEKGKYYVGKTNNPLFRLKDHFDANGSKWTQKYKPIEILELIPNCDSYDEDKYTQKYMDKFGIDNVRGGSFCEEILSDSNRKTLNQMNKSVNDQCFKCGKKGHFAKDCHVENKRINFTYSDYTSSSSSSDDDSYSSEEDEETRKKYRCFRCQRKGHYATHCFAKTNINGYPLK